MMSEANDIEAKRRSSDATYALSVGDNVQTHRNGEKDSNIMNDSKTI